MIEPRAEAPDAEGNRGSGTSGEETERPIVPMELGNRPEGPSGEQGWPGTWSRRRGAWVDGAEKGI